MQKVQKYIFKLKTGASQELTKCFKADIQGGAD